MSAGRVCTVTMEDEVETVDVDDASSSPPAAHHVSELQSAVNDEHEPPQTTESTPLTAVLLQVDNTSDAVHDDIEEIHDDYQVYLHARLHLNKLRQFSIHHIDATYKIQEAVLWQRDRATRFSVYKKACNQ